MDETKSAHHVAPGTPEPALDLEAFTPGTRVRVVQQMPLKGWTSDTVGIVQAYEQRKTGSWFAHAKDDKLWLDRLTLVKDDGEIVTLNLDRYAKVEVISPAPEVPAT